MRKYNHIGPVFEVSTRIDLINTNQFEVLINYARSKPFFSALLDTLPHHAHRSSIFDDAAFEIARVQQAVAKLFVLTQHRQQVNHSDWHPDRLIKQGNCCQLSLNDGTQGFGPTSFRIVTNASQIADKFENTTCRGNHSHTTSKEATEWDPQISIGVRHYRTHHRKQKNHHGSNK